MRKIQIVGILNVTPDSYHDGGQFQSVDAAVDRARKMVEDGADIIEIGGESTGPKSKDVSVDEELSRTVPVIRAVRSALPSAVLAIDTYKSAVAAAAIEEGVAMVNDVTAGRGDPSLFETVAKSDVRFVMMFGKDPTARTTTDDRRYDDVVSTVKAFLRERRDAAEAAGIHRSRIILDPGLGHFLSSDPRYSFEVLAKLREFEELECPIFLSPSRKSFVAGSEKLKTVDRLPGTIAASAIAVLNGATYVRTHDVLEVRRGCEIAGEIKN